MSKKHLFIILFSAIILTACSQIRKNHQQTASNNDPKEINSSAKSECEKAGGLQTKVKECDGSENDYCELNERIHCYADQVKDGQCEGVEFSESAYQQTGNGMIGAKSGPRVQCDFGQ